MPINELTSRKPGQTDEISQVIGAQGFYQNYYFKELKQRCLPPMSKDLVGVSRFYPMIRAGEDGEDLTPVVVDFEPPEADKSPMFCEEKRKFFMEKRILYIPIFRNEMLSKEEFAERVRKERENLLRGYREEIEDAALETVDIPMFSEESLMAEVDALALEAAKAMNLRGAVKAKKLPQLKAKFLKEKLDGMGRQSSTSGVPPVAR